MSRIAPVLSLLLAGLTLSCGGNQSARDAAPVSDTRVRSAGLPDGVVTTVNGIPITEMDVRHKLKSGGHDKEIPSAHRKDVLETIIRQELIRQRAIELGLNLEPEYREKRRRLEAQIDAFERKELSEAFFRREVAAKADVSEAEARKYFAENAARIRTELHVRQILRRAEGPIEQALQEIQRGTSFEDVARKQFPNLPETTPKPWDLGYLRWKQVPEPWREVVYDLKKGEVSGIIRGPRDRFWIIKLVDKRENREVTFESFRSTIMDVLKSEAVATLREKTERDLRDKARIVYREGPAAVGE